MFFLTVWMLSLKFSTSTFSSTTSSSLESKNKKGYDVFAAIAVRVLSNASPKINLFRHNVQNYFFFQKWLKHEGSNLTLTTRTTLVNISIKKHVLISTSVLQLIN